MNTTRVDVPDRLRKKRCLDCGHDGALVQGPTVFSCPRCGADLYARRPMSYAEMEGFDEVDRRSLHTSETVVMRRGVLPRVLRRLGRLFGRR